MFLDQDAILRILVSQRSQLTAYIWSIVRDVHITDDVFQELCLRAIKKCDEIQDESHLLAWLRTVSKNLAIDFLRKKNNQAIVFDQSVLELLESQWEEDSQVNQNETLDALRECLTALTPNAKEIIKLRYRDGLRSSEVAKKLGRKVEAIYKALTRTHRALILCIQGKMQSEETRGSDA